MGKMFHNKFEFSNKTYTRLNFIFLEKHIIEDVGERHSLLA